MKKILILFIFLSVIACSGSQEKEELEKTWLGKKVNAKRLKPVVNTYHMFDSTNQKVGAMVFGFLIEHDQLTVIDTSQFDDGSVYETAKFTFDFNELFLKSVDLTMKVRTTELLVQVKKEGESVKGLYRVTRDTLEREFPVDSIYDYDIFRSELYTFLHTLDYQEKDSLTFKAMVPTSLNVSEASITYGGEETIEVPMGTFDCDIIWLKADGKMPDNKIWIRKEEPRRIVKFYVPGSELDIELVSSVEHR